MNSIRLIIRKILKEQFQYSSDELRYNEIINALKYKEEDFFNDNETAFEEDLLDTEWLTIVIPKKDYIDYYELFVQSCWDALFQKEEYKGLSKKQAVIKLVNERFSEIAKKAGVSIGGYSFNNNILNVRFSRML
jgi:hypothetical protein